MHNAAPPSPALRATSPARGEVKKFLTFLYTEGSVTAGSRPSAL
jgi:hypothetical protein